MHSYCRITILAIYHYHQKKIGKDQHLYVGDYKIILVKFQTTL